MKIINRINACDRCMVALIDLKTTADVTLYYFISPCQAAQILLLDDVVVVFRGVQY